MAKVSLYYNFEYVQSLVAQYKLTSIVQLRSKFSSVYRIVNLKGENLSLIKWYYPSISEILEGFDTKNLTLLPETIFEVVQQSNCFTIEDFRKKYHNCYYQATKTKAGREALAPLKHKRNNVRKQFKDNQNTTILKTINEEVVKSQILEIPNSTLTLWKKKYPLEAQVAQKQVWWADIKKWYYEILALRAVNKSKTLLNKLGKKLGYKLIGYEKIEKEGNVEKRKNIYVKVQSLKYPELTTSVRLHLLKQGQNPFLLNWTTPEWLKQELALRGEKYHTYKQN